MIEFFKYHPLIEVPDFFSEIYAFIESADGTKSFQQKHYPDHFSPEFISKFKPWFEQLIGAKISGPSRGCVNITKFTGVNNEVPWHDEGGFDNGIKDQHSGSGEPQVNTDKEFMCFFWLASDHGHGGAFRFINDNTAELGVVELDPPGFLLATKYTLHSVERYSSQQFRMGFTIDFSVDQ